ncbi:muscle M-line assembly protein unc-89-like [Syngnathus typhle]|uniref:muscle M-line assembly protein unc-89-like n=1 Tax=Syngnathus typhle TaxID=161592 RepID=UPI002A6AD6E7|nr:muscle M-line assembly protein unc-89-like [Syngnathus typhle]
MNFSKLLCLVLVCSEQFGQVLATEQTEECKMADDGTAMTCKHKEGDTVKLTIAGAASDDVTWKKGITTISTQVNKIELASSDKNKVLTIKTLAESDEGEYTASGGGLTNSELFTVQVVPVCTAKQSETVTCKGKLAGELELKMDGGTGPFEWYKDDTKISADVSKYDGSVEAATLTILNLDVNDEEEFKGSANGETFKFAVQVAPICTGSSETPKACDGALNKDLVLKVGSTATKKVEWKKNNKPLNSDKYVKSGTDNIKLRITNLQAGDAGTYTATYTTEDKKESFTVNIPAAGDTKNNKKDNNSGGGSSSNNTSTDQVNFGDSKPKPKPEDGSGVGGLSYSPALLVTVTLVHLLLQLAA